ncbi:hypothetical protein HAX54_036905 [Datura stramonium]|uniref:SAC domain-containing protein n=1 Tax=Datura stramonium TaxID=4076 RepID=A0ABS8VKS5_DATST|nr:hypothetical protein [Datura stramonium]
MVYFLLRQSCRPSIQNLPGGGCVYTVTETQWIKISLQNPQPLGKGETKNVQEVMELDIDGKHYFCESRDITRPFPSRMPLQNPDGNLCGINGFQCPSKRLDFQSIVLFFCSVFPAFVLLFKPTLSVSESETDRCNILSFLINRGFAESRSFGSSGQQEGVVALLLVVGSTLGLGNEVECEQLVWVPKSAVQSVPFNTYIWRRGTIPMWWGAELKLTAAEAEIYVSKRDPYKGSAQYYQGKSESILVQHFEESLNYIRSTGKLPYTRVHLINYDWHASVKLKGEQQTIEGLWYLLKAPTISISIRIICLLFSASKIAKVFMEQCRRLGISLDSDLAYGYQSYNNNGDTAPLLLAGKRTDANIHIALYTGSKAMHSQILSIFNEEAGKFKQFSAAQNMKITLQKPLYVASRPTGCFLKPIVNIFPISDVGASLLSFKRKAMTWLHLQATDLMSGWALSAGGLKLVLEGLLYHNTATFPLYDFGNLKEKWIFLLSCCCTHVLICYGWWRPITLGEIEILGMCLPWRFILKHEGSSTGFLNKQKPNMMQQATENVFHGGDDLLDFLDDAFVQQPKEANISNMSKGPSDNNTQRYLDCFSAPCGTPNGEKDKLLMEAVELETERFR